MSVRQRFEIEGVTTRFLIALLIPMATGCVELSTIDYYAPQSGIRERSFRGNVYDCSIEGPPDVLVADDGDVTLRVRFSSSTFPWLVGPDIIFPAPVLPAFPLLLFAFGGSAAGTYLELELTAGPEPVVVNPQAITVEGQPLGESYVFTDDGPLVHHEIGGTIVIPGGESRRIVSRVHWLPYERAAVTFGDGFIRGNRIELSTVEFSRESDALLIRWR